MAKRIWFILGGLWLVLSAVYLFYNDYMMAHTALAVACGYPDAAAKAYAACTAKDLPMANAAMWHWFLTIHLVWVLSPTIVLAAVGFLLRKRA